MGHVSEARARRGALRVSGAITLVAALLVVLAVLVLPGQAPAAGSGGQAPTPSPGPSDVGSTVTKAVSGTAVTGARIYGQQCMICHDVDAEGDGPRWTMQLPPPANLTAVQDSPAMASSIIMNGLPGSDMPAHMDMTSSEVDDLLAFLRTQALDTTREYTGDFGTAPPAKPGTAAAIYAQDCADCHGATGHGDGPWAKNPYVWPKPADFTARNSLVERNYDIILNGIEGTYMAPQTPAISETACWALAQYVTDMLQPGSGGTIQTGSIQRRTDPYSVNDRNAWVSGLGAANLYCTVCHGGEVNGTLIAPKLSDRDWRYGGGTDTALFQVIENGIPGKLMPPHAALPEKIRWQLITYIRWHGGLPNPLEVDPTPAGVTVTISGNRYTPADIVVAPGTVVTWVNNDPTPHTATDNNWVSGKPASQQQPDSWTSGVIPPNGKASHRFTQPGVYMYMCRIHPYMFGSVAVDTTAATVYSSAGPSDQGLAWYWIVLIIAALVPLVAFVVWILLRRMRGVHSSSSSAGGGT